MPSCCASHSMDTEKSKCIMVDPVRSLYTLPYMYECSSQSVKWRWLEIDTPDKMFLGRRFLFRSKKIQNKNIECYHNKHVDIHTYPWTVTMCFAWTQLAIWNLTSKNYPSFKRNELQITSDSINRVLHLSQLMVLYGWGK